MTGPYILSFLSFKATRDYDWKRLWLPRVVNNTAELLGSAVSYTVFNHFYIANWVLCDWWIVGSFFVSTFTYISPSSVCFERPKICTVFAYMLIYSFFHNLAFSGTSSTLQHIFVVPCASFSTTETLISYSVPSAPHLNEETRLNPFSKKMGRKSCVTVPLTL